jgi:hypothetical protein
VCGCCVWVGAHACVCVKGEQCCARRCVLMLIGRGRCESHAQQCELTSAGNRSERVLHSCPTCSVWRVCTLVVWLVACACGRVGPRRACRAAQRQHKPRSTWPNSHAHLDVRRSKVEDGLQQVPGQAARARRALGACGSATRTQRRVTPSLAARTARRSTRQHELPTPPGSHAPVKPPT